MTLFNNYLILRHGSAVSNKKGIASSWPEKFHNPLTKKGKKQIQKLISKLKKKDINLILSSDLLRTKQTAEIISNKLAVEVKFNECLREIDFGIFNGKLLKQWKDFFRTKKEKFTRKPSKGENYKDLIIRTKKFIKKVEKKYKKKNVLVISHGANLVVFQAIIEELSRDEIVKNKNKLLLETGELRILK